MKDKDKPKSETPESQETMTLGDKLRASFKKSGLNVPYYPGQIVKKRF